MPETREKILFSMKNMNKVFPVAIDVLEKAKEINRFALMGKRPRVLLASAVYLAGLLRLAVVIVPNAARELCRESIEYLDSNALDRFEAKRQEIRDILTDFKKNTGLQDTLEKSLGLIEKDGD